MKALAPIVLAPLSALYGAVTQARLGFYRRGLLNVRRLSAPVISVGNITTGGTGKTPLVEFVARALAQRGQGACVLTRGYGRENSGSRVLVSDGERILANEKEAGDEPRLLAENLLGIAAVISDADRFAAGEWAIKHLGSAVFILDDGFQHLSLARNLNIVVIDATGPWGQGHLLPWGHLRESAGGISRADCVVITRADQLESISTLRDELNRLIPNKPIFTSRMTTRKVKQLPVRSSDTQTQLEEKTPTTSQPIGAFCGIGNPASFLAQLKSAGYQPVTSAIFPDHHRYSPGDIANIVSKAKAAGARSLITTAKDAVKLSGCAFELPCLVLEIEIRIDDESAFLEMLDSCLTR